MRIKIGELAKISGLSVGAIRFYEKAGVLEAADRTAGNYRLYGDEQIERLRFIRHCRMQGLSLEEIQILLNTIKHPDRSCGAVHNLIDKHIRQIDRQLSDLQDLKQKLQAIKTDSQCKGHEGCNIIHLLAGEDDCSFCSELRKREDNKKGA